MHVLSVDQRTQRKRRSNVEKVFQRVNTLILAAQLATLLVTVGLLGAAATKSMSNSFFSTSDLKLNAQYNYANCSKTFTTSNNLFTDYRFTVSKDNIQFLVARAVYNIRRCVGMYATFISVGAVNKLLFDMNIHYIKLGQLVLRKDILSTAEAFLLVLSFITTKNIERENGLLADYVSTCASETPNAPGDGSTLFQITVPFVAFYVGLAMSTVVMFFSLATAVVLMWKPHPRDEEKRSREERAPVKYSVYGGEVSDQEEEFNDVDGGYQESDNDAGGTHNAAAAAGPVISGDAVGP